ncbi:glutathione S-transferase family protein [Rhizobium sp. SG2393]|uniref:glutathione S-transferase family protein n=1 Tax=Rhizobium sp. SG2393 TaxID=3276279 RepID=UPI00366AA2A4
MSLTLYALAGADPARPFSPHVWKVAMALAHKGLAAETVAVGFTAIPAIENGATKLVPLLKDGDTLVSDSFAIARYLEETYPDRPSLFGGPGGLATARFVEGFSQTRVHPLLTPILITDIHAMLAPADQAYFRESREKRLGRTLEETAAGAPAAITELRTRLEPLRHTLRHQPFLGGEAPLFADYIVFGAFQWARIVSKTMVLEADDPVTLWFDRCLDLHAALGRSVTAA